MLNTNPAMQQKSTSASRLGRFQSHCRRRTCTHAPKPTQTKPLRGEAGDRKLTSAQELGNRFCHFRSVPAALVTSSTTPRLATSDLSSSRPAVASFQCESVGALGRREGDPRRDSGAVVIRFGYISLAMAMGSN